MSEYRLKWPGIPPGFTADVVAEPLLGFIDITSHFTGPGGPLAAGQWSILAQSETPGPVSFFLLGSGLAVVALLPRMRHMFGRNNLH